MKITSPLILRCKKKKKTTTLTASWHSVIISFISRKVLLAKLDKRGNIRSHMEKKTHRLPLPILLAASLQTFSCILCTTSIHRVAHYWFIYHMQDKVTLDLDLEIMSVRSCDQISAAGKNMLYFNITFKKKKKKDVQYIG